MPATITHPAFRATLIYPSGREIYVGQHPEHAEFHEAQRRAARWQDEQAAQDAADALKAAFELRSPAELKVRIDPIH